MAHERVSAKRMSKGPATHSPETNPPRPAAEPDDKSRPLFTVPEAARLLKSTQRAVRQLLAKNRLDVRRDEVTGISGITASSLLAYQSEIKSAGTSGPHSAVTTAPDEPSKVENIAATFEQVTVKSLICRPLVQVLGEVEDFRMHRGRRYKLSTLLMFVCAAMLCGCSTYAEIVQWGERHRGLLTRALGVHHPPSIRTIRLMFRGLDPRDLSARLHAWCTSISELLADRVGISLTRDTDIKVRGHLLSALRRRHLVIGSDSLMTLGRRLGIQNLTEVSNGDETEERILSGLFQALFFEGNIAYVTFTRRTTPPAI